MTFSHYLKHKFLLSADNTDSLILNKNTWKVSSFLNNLKEKFNFNSGI